MLKLMRRGHKRSDYLERIQRQNSSRRLALTSDIIVGFPGETDDDFRQTIELVEACEYDSIYIFKYSRRAVPAADFDDNVSEKEDKQIPGTGKGSSTNSGEDLRFLCRTR